MKLFKDTSSSGQKDRTVPPKLLNAVGRRATVSGYDAAGTIRFAGFHHIKNHLRLGIELDYPIGNNDGTVGGFAYFSCAAKHGVLVHPRKVQLEPTSKSAEPLFEMIGPCQEVDDDTELESALALWRGQDSAAFGDDSMATKESMLDLSAHIDRSESFASSAAHDEVPHSALSPGTVNDDEILDLTAYIDRSNSFASSVGSLASPPPPSERSPSGKQEPIAEVVESSTVRLDLVESSFLTYRHDLELLGSRLRELSDRLAVCERPMLRFDVGDTLSEA